MQLDVTDAGVEGELNSGIVVAESVFSELKRFDEASVLLEALLEVLNDVIACFSFVIVLVATMLDLPLKGQ